MGSNEPYVDMPVQQEFDVILKCFAKVDIVGKVTIKSKLCEIAYPDMTSICLPFNKLKTKGSQKGHVSKLEKSTNCDPSYFEHVDVLHFVNDNSLSWKSSKASDQNVNLTKIHIRNISMLHQFHVNLHSYILDIVDVKADDHCGYHPVAILLDMGEEAWPIVRNNFLKKLGL